MQMQAQEDNHSIFNDRISTIRGIVNNPEARRELRLVLCDWFTGYLQTIDGETGECLTPMTSNYFCLQEWLDAAQHPHETWQFGQPSPECKPLYLTQAIIDIATNAEEQQTVRRVIREWFTGYLVCRHAATGDSLERHTSAFLALQEWLELPVTTKEEVRLMAQAPSLNQTPAVAYA